MTSRTQEGRSGEQHAIDQQQEAYNRELEREHRADMRE